jgi:hypothetical protein
MFSADSRFDCTAADTILLTKHDISASLRSLLWGLCIFGLFTIDSKLVKSKWGNCKVNSESYRRKNEKQQAKIVQRERESGASNSLPSRRQNERWPTNFGSCLCAGLMRCVVWMRRRVKESKLHTRRNTNNDEKCSLHLALMSSVSFSSRWIQSATFITVFCIFQIK